MENKDIKVTIDEYIEYLDVKKITKDSYKRILYKWYDYITTLSIKYPKRNDVLKYKEYLMKNLSSSTVQKSLVVLRGFYKHCKVNGYSEDITEGVKGVKVSQTFQRQPLSLDDSRKLLNRAKRGSDGVLGKRDYAIVALLLTTGLRVVEVERANVEDLNIIDNEHVLFVMGKGRDAKDIYVKLSNEVYEIIEDYLLFRNNNHDALFITHNRRFENSRLSTKRIRSIVKELLISIGYDSKVYSVHSLRHTFATNALNLGASIMETKEALRHSDVSTTQIYVHMLETMQSDTNQKVSDALFKKKK
jgi:integrase/recombinase XerD